MTMTEEYTLASKSMAVAHAMRPQLQAVARVVTGNQKLTIEFDGKGSRTDAKNRIWLTPPGDLGRHRSHTRSECSRYDEIGFSLCQACREEESLFATALHECAHVAYGTGESPSDEMIKQIQKIWIDRFAKRRLDDRIMYRNLKREADGVEVTSDMLERDELDDKAWVEGLKRSEGVRRWDDILNRRSLRDGYMSAASAVSPWLPGLFNAVEDARVNRMLHSHRPGTTRMFEASTRSIMEDGIIDLEGNPIRWIDRDVDQQVMLASLLLASKFEFDFASCLIPEATEVYEDPTLSRLIDLVGETENVHELFDIARGLLVRLQELGYMEDPDDDGGDGDGEGDPGGDGGGGGGTTVLVRSDDGDVAVAVDEGGESGGGAGGEEDDAGKRARDGHALVKILGGHADEIEEELNELLGEDGDPVDAEELGELKSPPPKWDVDDDEMDLAAVHFEYFDEPPRGIGQVREYRFTDSGRPAGTFTRIKEHFDGSGDGYYGSHYSIDDVEGVRWAAAQHLPIMRKIFTENRAVKTTRHLKTGKIDTMNLGRKIKTGREDVFRKRDKPTSRSYGVVIGLDISGSTAGGWLKPMKTAAFAQAEMLARANIPFEFNCHTGTSATSHRGYDLEIIKIKDWDERWQSDKHLERVQAILPGSANLDGHTFEYYRKSVEKRREDVGLVLYFTDGAMPAENRREEEEILLREIKYIKRRKDLEMLAIGVGNTEPEEYGLEMVRYDSLADLPKLLKALEKKLLRIV